MNKIKVYIADDQTLFRKGMARLLRSFPEVGEVREASNGRELLALVNTDCPDVILMDLEMPVMNGMEATEKILHKFPDVKIVVLSMHDHQSQIYALMELGAHAFLPKDAEPEEVQKALVAVVKNDFYQNQLVIDALRKGAMHKKAVEKVESIKLTERENEVLLLICQEYTMKEISERLFLSEKTIHNHRARIMSKLQVKNTVGLVRYAYTSGLIKIQ